MYKFSLYLEKLLSENPTFPIHKLGKSKEWIKARLSLAKLPSNIGQLLDKGCLNLSNAYALARFPDKANEHLDSALNDTPEKFIPMFMGKD